MTRSDAKKAGLVLIALVLLGCTGLQNGVDPVANAKSIESIQEFIDEHPNAKITSQYVTAEKSKSLLKQFPECNLVEPQALYFISFTEDQRSATAFVSATQQTLCVTTSNAAPTGKPGATPEPTLTPVPTATATAAPTVTPVVSSTPSPKQAYCITEGRDFSDIFVEGVEGQPAAACCPGLQPYLQIGHEGATCLKEAPKPPYCEDLGGACTLKTNNVWPCPDKSQWEIEGAVCPKDETATATGKTVVCCTKPEPSTIEGACAPEGKYLNDAMNPNGPTDYLKCCSGLVADLAPGEIAGVCVKPENVRKYQCANEGQRLIRTDENPGNYDFRECCPGLAEQFENGQLTGICIKPRSCETTGGTCQYPCESGWREVSQQYTCPTQSGSDGQTIYPNCCTRG